ncbi:MAG: hypothetical protein QF797_21200 [Alphaproteobacteria bacterium]|jgi:hypothetical protein|nr:hypothetical protein [Rhodospirillaceae bacterium]MDP6407720.1 hypothetical protein [Alphaproteobacteria bacterium]MDP6622766.1 hypothetical protein [Alphaproteobacteria bacterium]|tara:strand:- start:14 stop:325 length:312 start_codon:yes stop_codon:yes gene_type:complete
MDGQQQEKIIQELARDYESRCENWSWVIRLAKLTLLLLLIGKLYIAVLLMFGLYCLEHQLLAPFGYRPTTGFLVDLIVSKEKFIARRLAQRKEPPHEGLAPDG